MIELESKDLNAFIHLIHRLAGITMDVSRKSLIQNRLRPRLRDLELTHYHQYLEIVLKDEAEAKTFIDLLTTNETYFYRTPRIWSYTRDFYLPAWFAAHPGRTFSVWSAAASSGEEANTIGLVLQEFKDRNPAFQYQILGTDICRDVLKKAETGGYSERSIQHLRDGQPELFKKYISFKDDAYHVHEKIRSHIQFRRHNLFEVLSGNETFDLVLLRNVLIYFTPADQEKVLAKVRLAIKPDGKLVIGESESLGQIQSSFSFVMPLIYEVAA